MGLLREQGENWKIDCSIPHLNVYGALATTNILLCLTMINYKFIESLQYYLSFQN